MIVTQCMSINVEHIATDSLPVELGLDRASTCFPHCSSAIVIIEQSTYLRPETCRFTIGDDSAASLPNNAGEPHFRRDDHGATDGHSLQDNIAKIFRV